MIERCCIPALLAGVMTLMLPSCAMHVSTLTPAQNFQLTTDQSLDVIAHANQLVEQTAAALPVGLVAVNDQRAIITYSAAAAQSIAAAHTALVGTQTAAQRTAAVLAALKSITVLPASLQTFLKNPQSSQTVINLVSIIQNSVTLAQALASNVQATPAGGN